MDSRTSVRCGLVAATATCLIAATGMPATAQPRAPHAGRQWSRYVLAPDSDLVRPVRTSVLSGDVRRPGGLERHAGGAVTLTVVAGGPPATLLLDYGREMVGTPYVTAHAAAADAGVDPTLRLTFSETRKYLVDATGALTGDQVGTGGYSREQAIPVTGAGRTSGTFEGGFRYETITLDKPGRVTLDAAGLRFEAYRAPAEKYQGHFLSSSDALNRMWFDGAYTDQTDMAAAGIQGALAPSVLDGAKRDRKLWSGDIAIEGPGILASLGSNGADYVKESLRALLRLSRPGSGLAGFGVPSGGSSGLDPAYSNSYSSWTVDDVVAYFRATGDASFAREALPYLEQQLAYDATLTDARGLLDLADVFGGADSGIDWDIYDGPRGGVITSANMLYYRILQDVAYVERQLGHAGRAAGHIATAAAVKDAINADLFDPSTGAYDMSATQPGVIAQDANTFALLFGVAPADKVAGIVAALKSLWGPQGSAPFSAQAGKSPTISPFIAGLEVQALYRVGDAAGAERLLHLTWDKMIDPANPQYTGTFWENYLPDGTLQDGSISASHGWSSGPTPALSSYVLGVQAVDPGYRTFTVAPRLGSLRWARGAVPTPSGPIEVAATRQRGGTRLTLRVPVGTTATVVSPSGGRLTIGGGARGARRTLTMR